MVNLTIPTKIKDLSYLSVGSWFSWDFIARDPAFGGMGYEMHVGMLCLAGIRLFSGGYGDSDS